MTEREQVAADGCRPASTGSDGQALVGVEAISKRVKDHLDAGADHVCVQVFDAEPHGLPLMQWRTLAKAML